VQALAAEEEAVTPRLAALVRRELVAPEKALVPGDDGFRFRHLLIRDVAYEALPKARRAELHERHARWLEERGTNLVELDELLGYHLEQAVRYRVELGQSVDPDLAAAARQRLTGAGRRALRRSDFAAAISLLERAAQMPREELDLSLETDLIDALSWARDVDDAIDRARMTTEQAAAAGDRIGELCGRIEEAVLRAKVEPAGATEALEALIAEALPVFEDAGDDLALRIAYCALGQVANMRAQMDKLVDAYERAEAHAGPAGMTALVGFQSHGRFFGSTPLSDLLAWQEAQDPREQRSYWLRTHRATALAMLDRLDESRALVRELRSEAAERGAYGVLAAIEAQATDIELLGGAPAAAVEAGREACRLYERVGHLSELSTAAGGLAHAYYELGELAEAERWAGRSAELGAADDAATQMLWRQIQAQVLARRGKVGDAEQLARQAVAIAVNTENPNGQAGAFAALGEVLAMAGRPEEALAAFEEALERYEPKENLVMAGRTRDRLAAIIG
jgi:tetratricopeptide (TPR) repeat protein